MDPHSEPAARAQLPLGTPDPHTSQGHTAPAASRPGCLLRCRHPWRPRDRACSSRPAAPARARPPEAHRSPGIVLSGQPKGSSWRETGRARGPGTHRQTTTAAAATTQLTLYQARGLCRPAGRGAALARAPWIGCRQPRPGPAPSRGCGKSYARTSTCRGRSARVTCSDVNWGLASCRPCKIASLAASQGLRLRRRLRPRYCG